MKLDADTTFLQRRVSSACGIGSAIRLVKEDGTVVCDEDDDTTYSAGAGLTLSVTQFRVRFGGPGSAETVSGSDHDPGDDYWMLAGNARTNPGTDFLGTTDEPALEMHVNGVRALRLEPAPSPNVIGGSSRNGVTEGAYGATIPGWQKQLVEPDHGSLGHRGRWIERLSRR